MARADRRGRESSSPGDVCTRNTNAVGVWRRAGGALRSRATRRQGGRQGISGLVSACAVPPAVRWRLRELCRGSARAGRPGGHSPHARRVRLRPSGTIDPTPSPSPARTCRGCRARGPARGSGRRWARSARRPRASGSSARGGLRARGPRNAARSVSPAPRPARPRPRRPMRRKHAALGVLRAARAHSVPRGTGAAARAVLRPPRAGVPRASRGCAPNRRRVRSHPKRLSCSPRSSRAVSLRPVGRRGSGCRPPARTGLAPKRPVPTPDAGCRRAPRGPRPGATRPASAESACAVDADDSSAPRAG